MEYFEKLQKIVSNLKLSQTEIAEKMGISRQQFNNVLNGRGKFTDVQLVKLHDLFNINLNWLLTGRGQMFLDQEPDNVMTIELNAGQELRVVRRD